MGRNKKIKIIGLSISLALVGTGTGVVIGYGIWHNSKPTTDVVNINTADGLEKYLNDHVQTVKEDHTFAVKLPTGAYDKDLLQSDYEFIKSNINLQLLINGVLAQFLWMIESSYYHIDTDSINVNIYQSKFNFNRCYIDMKISADWINNSISYIISYTNGFYESSTFYDEDVSDEIYDFNDDFHYDPNDKEDASNHYLCEIFKMQQDCGKFYAIT